jgi:hypothetical protein
MDSQEHEQDQHDVENPPTTEPEPIAQAEPVDQTDTAAVAPSPVAVMTATEVDAEVGTSAEVASEAETAEAEIPEAEASEASEVETAEVETAEVETAEAETAEVETAEAEIPEADASAEVDVPNEVADEADASAEVDASTIEVVEVADSASSEEEADAAPIVTDEAVDETLAVEEEQEAAPEVSATPGESEELVALVSTETTTPDAIAEVEDTPADETLEAVATANAPETKEQASAPDVTEPAPDGSDDGAGRGSEVEHLLAATHQALRDLSERFAATVDHIGTLLSSRRSATEPKEVDTPAEATGEIPAADEAASVEAAPATHQETEPTE